MSSHSNWRSPIRRYIPFLSGLRLDTVEEYQAVVDAEWNILYNKLDSLVQSHAKVVLSKLPIGDVATQYFADR